MTTKTSAKNQTDKNSTKVFNSKFYLLKIEMLNCMTLLWVDC